MFNSHKFQTLQVTENTCLPTTTYTYGPLDAMSNMTHHTYTDIGITHVQHAGDDSEGWQQKPGVWQEA